MALGPRRAVSATARVVPIALGVFCAVCRHQLGWRPIGFQQHGHLLHGFAHVSKE
jgi:hypothetical protein